MSYRLVDTVVFHKCLHHSPLFDVNTAPSRLTAELSPTKSLLPLLSLQFYLLFDAAS